jgi:hypothetical protein
LIKNSPSETRNSTPYPNPKPALFAPQLTNAPNAKPLDFCSPDRRSKPGNCRRGVFVAQNP